MRSSTHRRPARTGPRSGESASWARPSRRYPDGVLGVLAAFHVLVSIFLVVLVLMHSGRDTGFGGLGFTPASQGGQHIVERNLTRLTIVVALVFTATSIGLFYLLR
jgi:preprotein translocase subunit SecG